MQNGCYRRCKLNNRKRRRIKRRKEKRLEAMLKPTLDSLSQLCISQPSSSRLDGAEAGLPSLAELYVSRPPPVQGALTTSNESAIQPLVQFSMPSFWRSEQPMHSPLPETPPPPPTSPLHPPLPSSPPPPQPPPPPYDPPDNEIGNSGGEAVENNNCVTYTQNILAATYEANLNFLRHYLEYYNYYSGLQN